MTTTHKISAARAPVPSPRTLARGAEPDLVDRIFDYLAPLLADRSRADVDELKTAVREKFAGSACYIRAREDRTHEVLAMFNGRNATEVARRLHISRASVYRYLKQPGDAVPRHTVCEGNKSCLSFPGNETAEPLASSPALANPGAAQQNPEMTPA